MEGAKEDIPNFSGWCKDGVERLDQAAWNAELSGRFACTRLTLDLVEHEKVPELRTAFSDALEAHAKSVLDGKNVPPEALRSKWERLLGCLTDEATRKVLRTRLVDAATSQDGKLHEAFFEMYGGEISDPDTLVANERVVSHLFSPVVRHRNIAALRWLDNFFDGNRDFLENVSDENTVQEFENRLRDYVSEPADDDAQPLIAGIAERLGIEAVKVVAEKSDETSASDEPSQDNESDE